MAALARSGPLPVGQRGEWAIYDESDNPVIPFDTFFSLTFGQENKVAEKPVERGKFVNYNKTVSAKRITVRLGKTGNPTELSAYLDALEKLCAGTDLLSVVTPEKTYLNVNATRYDYDRTTDTGVDRIVVDLSLQEIAQVEARYSDEALTQGNVKNAKMPTALTGVSSRPTRMPPWPRKFKRGLAYDARTPCRPAGSAPANHSG